MGLYLFKGCEANILDIEGNLDISERESQYLDYMHCIFS